MIVFIDEHKLEKKEAPAKTLSISIVDDSKKDMIFVDPKHQIKQEAYKMYVSINTRGGVS